MKFYQKTWFIILMLIFVWPVGLFLMWKYTAWNKILKGVITVFLVWLAYGMITAKPQPKQEAVAPAKTEQPAKLPEKKEEKQAKAPSDKEIFDTVTKLLHEEFKNKKHFPYTIDTDITVDEKEKRITMMAVMNDGLKKWVALEFADTMIRRFSSEVSFRSDKWSGPTNDKYGTLFDEYSIYVGVAPLSQVKKQGNWYYEKYILPKMHTKQGPDWKEAQRKGE